VGDGRAVHPGTRTRRIGRCRAGTQGSKFGAPGFQQAQVPIVWGTHPGSTHFEVLDTGGVYKAPLTAWFRARLMGDTKAAAWFEGAQCTLCTTPGWTVQHNVLWQ
jgi:hypothetical protein